MVERIHLRQGFMYKKEYSKRIKYVKLFMVTMLVLIVGFVIILYIFPKGIAALFGAFGTELSARNPATKYSMGIGVRMIGMLVFVPIMMHLNNLKGFTYKIDKKGLLLSWLFYVYILANLEIGSMGSVTPFLIVLMIAEGFAIGFYEEILFRGILLRQLMSSLGEGRRNTILAIVASSVLFGLVHLINLQSGASAVSVCAQVCYTFMMGIAFSVLFLRTNRNLVWCGILHSLYDIAEGFGDLAAVSAASEAIQGQTANVSTYAFNLMLFLPLLLYSIFLMRKV